MNPHNITVTVGYTNFTPQLWPMEFMEISFFRTVMTHESNNIRAYQKYTCAVQDVTSHNTNTAEPRALLIKGDNMKEDVLHVQFQRSFKI